MNKSVNHGKNCFPKRNPRKFYKVKVRGNKEIPINMNGGGFENCEGQDGKNTVIDVNPDPGKQKAIHREGNHVRNFR